MLKVCWFGYGGHALYAEALRPIIQELGMELVTIHEWDTANIKWTLATWKPELQKMDIVICPTDPAKFPAKSQNKLTQAMSMGIPVICSSLDAYKAVEEKHPRCCLFADTPEQWKEQLTKLRDDAQFRQEIVLKGFAACRDFHIDRIGEKWIKVVSNLDKVDIVIPTYKNLRGLQMCLDSIRKCTDVKYRMIIVDNGDSKEMQAYLETQADITYIKKAPLNFAQAVNEGIRAGTSKYVMILNDDVIVSKGWLRTMTHTCKGDIGVVGPLSNCDKGWLHTYSINIGGVELEPGLNTFEQIEPIIPQIYDYASPYHQIHDREWAAFYCTLIRRDILEKAGLLNEEFVNSGEDVDLCYRIKKQGFRIVQDYKCFVFHFGAVSRKVLEKENPGSYHEADKRTNQHLHKLWNKKSVMIYSGPSWEKWDFRNVDQGGIGGSETWQVMLARELAKLNYRVTVMCDCPEPGIKDGDIDYLHYADYGRYVEQHWMDYFISSRTTDTLRFPVRAGKVYVMIHDVFLLSDRYQLFPEKVTKYCVLSRWHWEFVKSYHGIDDKKLSLTSNGIDFGRFDSIQGVERNRYRLHWSSSLDRGLDTLLYLFDFMKAEIPELELHIFYGIDTWKKSALMHNKQDDLKKMDELEKAMKKPGIFYHGRVGQKELAIEEKKASLLAYSTDFEESFFITGIECQRAGVPIVASNYAGLQTTIGDSGILIGSGNKGEPYTREYRIEFVNKCLELLKDRAKWQEWSDKGMANTEKYSWANVALMWKKLFEEG